ncbi:hypothetical protein [Aquiflexum lacus]|uniref:hypothetical protein n=1 Tax=Aquiflexum lacus TaxID=2483805 RepID=UPI00189503D8|nr:hypothetical protein [Aquiflexum lacus]
MGLKNFKIWGIFMIAIIIVAFMLFQQSNTNKRELDEQAIRNMELIKGNFQVAFQSYTNQKLQEERRRILNLGPQSKFKKFEDFNFVKVNSVELLHENQQEVPILVLNISSSMQEIISLDQLFAKINNQDFFKPVFLTDDSGQILYPRSEIGKSLQLIEGEVDAPLLPTNKQEILYHDEKHLIYYTPVLIGNYKFYLVGAIKLQDFESIGWKVDFTNLTILVFLLGLMLFSLPIFSFFGLAKGDRLTKFGVFSVGLSLVGILVILGFGFSFFKSHHPLPDDHHKMIQNAIKDSIQRNLLEKVKLLDNWDYSINKSNDLIRINTIGGVEQIYQEGSMDTASQLYRSLRHREYYSYFLTPTNKGDNPNFNLSKAGNRYIGSHYSLDNSKLESVISRLSVAEDSINTAFGNHVEAITFFWQDRLTDYDDKREYLLFKKNGLIIHKSRRIKIAADSLSQLLSANKWEEVEGIMKSNSNQSADSEWKIPLYLDGHAYQGHLIMVSDNDSLKFDQPLWMLYLKDEHLEHAYSSLVTFETILLLLFYLLMLALISLANKLNKSKSKNKTLEKFAYNYLYPKKAKVKNFEYLIWFMVIYIFIILYYYHLPRIHFFGIFAVLLIATFHFKVIMYMMLGPSWQNINNQVTTKENKKIIRNSRNQEIRRFFWIMGVILAISFWFLCCLIPVIHFLFLLIWVVGSSYYTFKKRKKFVGEKPQLLNPTDHSGSPSYGANNSGFNYFPYIYTSFFIMWIFMIGFVPGYIIYSKVHQYESKNWEPQKNPDDYENTPDNFWNTYDEGRRLFFGGLTSQNTSQVKEFIFTDRRLMQPKLEQIKIIDTKSLVKPFKKLMGNLLWSGSVTLFFLMILALFIWMVHTLSKKIYFLDLEGFLYHQKNLNTSTLSQKVFICGLDSENYPKWIQDLLDLGKHEITDCTSNPELKWQESTIPDLEGKNIWIIKNVHCLPDLSLFLERLPQFIRALNGKIYFVISSGVSWKQLLHQLEDPKQNMIFSQLFSSFHFEYVPIDLDPNLKVITPNDEKANMLIRSRKAYFYNIWSEMSFDEKKICYYFSREGFFNFTNKPVITELIQKGILVPRGILDGSGSTELFPILFDKHFRLFILNNISEEEIQAFKRDEDKHGNASSIQIAVFSFILLSVALISYFDKNFLDQASTFVAGITGALGGIYSLLKNSLPTLNKSKS